MPALLARGHAGVGVVDDPVDPPFGPELGSQISQFRGDAGVAIRPGLDETQRIPQRLADMNQALEHARGPLEVDRAHSSSWRGLSPVCEGAERFVTLCGLGLCSVHVCMPKRLGDQVEQGGGRRSDPQSGDLLIQQSRVRPASQKPRPCRSDGAEDRGLRVLVQLS